MAAPHCRNGSCRYIRAMNNPIFGEYYQKRLIKASLKFVKFENAWTFLCKISWNHIILLNAKYFTILYWLFGFFVKILGTFYCKSFFEKHVNGSLQKKSRENMLLWAGQRKIFPFEVPRPSKVPFVYGNTSCGVSSPGIQNWLDLNLLKNECVQRKL